MRALRNFRAEQPYQQSVYYAAVLTSEQMWTKEELLDAAQEMTKEQVQNFIPVVLSRLYLEFLIYGNVDESRAFHIVDMVESTLAKNAGTRPLLPSQLRRFREIQLPNQSSLVLERQNEVHKSSALMSYFQTGVQDTNANMLLELFCQIINEPCFDMLRTKEQLGEKEMNMIRPFKIGNRFRVFRRP